MRRRALTLFLDQLPIVALTLTLTLTLTLNLTSTPTLTSEAAAYTEGRWPLPLPGRRCRGRSGRSRREIGEIGPGDRETARTPEERRSGGRGGN